MKIADGRLALIEITASDQRRRSIRLAERLLAGMRLVLDEMPAERRARARGHWECSPGHRRSTRSALGLEALVPAPSMEPLPYRSALNASASFMLRIATTACALGFVCA